MKKHLTLILLLLSSGTLFAQFDFENTQSFYREPVVLPKIGFDYIRAQYQQIIEQRPQTGTPGSWTDQARYITRRGPGFYTEIGIYDYDTIKNTWIVNKSDVYTNTFNPLTHTLETSAWVRHYADSTTNNFWRARSFFIATRPDSIVTERIPTTGGTAYVPMWAKKLLYAPDDRLLRTRTYYAANEVFTDTFFYDSQNRVVRHLSLDQKPGSSIRDSSSQDFYTYDSLGHIVQYTTQLYVGTGWLTLRQSSYNYDLLGNLIYAASSYYNSQTQSMKLTLEFYYTHNFSNKVVTYREVVYTNTGDTSDIRTQFVYDFAQNPLYALGYPKNGNGYDSVPMLKYLFEEPVLTSVKRVAVPDQVKMYPNPVKDVIHFSVPVSGHILVYDLSGRCMKDVQTTGTVTELSVEQLQRGNYLMYVEGAVAVRFLKE